MKLIKGRYTKLFLECKTTSCWYNQNHNERYNCR